MEDAMIRSAVSAGMLCTCALVAGACSSARENGEAVSQAEAIRATATTTAAPLITFTSSWTDSVSGPIVAGQPVEVAYDSARLASQCGGDPYSPGGGGGFAWGITGYYQIGGAAPESFQVTITSAWASGNATFTPATSGPMQMWFGCSNTTGNPGWDSNYGKNYAFTVQPAAVDAGADATTKGTVIVQVLGDAIQGNAGSTPPDKIVSSPLANVLVYDGPWEAGSPLGETDASGTFTATLSLGVHQVGIMEITTDESMFSSDGNAVTVTTTPTTLVIHVVPDVLSLEASYDAGYGNALYVTGESASLGNWGTAYKAGYNASVGQWQFSTHVPAGAQYKLILAPWVDGPTIPVSSAGVQWQSGSNLVAPSSVFTVLNLTPSF